MSPIQQLSDWLRRRCDEPARDEHAACIRRCTTCLTYHVWTGGQAHIQFHYSEMDACYLGNVIALLERRALRDARYIEGVDDENGNEADPFDAVLDVVRPKYIACMKAELLCKIKKEP